MNNIFSYPELTEALKRRATFRSATLNLSVVESSTAASTPKFRTNEEEETERKACLETALTKKVAQELEENLKNPIQTFSSNAGGEEDQEKAGFKF